MYLILSKLSVWTNNLGPATATRSEIIFNNNIECERHISLSHSRQTSSYLRSQVNQRIVGNKNKHTCCTTLGCTVQKGKGAKKILSRRSRTAGLKIYYRHFWAEVWTITVLRSTSWATTGARLYLQPWPWSVRKMTVPLTPVRAFLVECAQRGLGVLKLSCSGLEMQMNFLKNEKQKNKHRTENTSKQQKNPTPVLFSITLIKKKYKRLKNEKPRK